MGPVIYEEVVIAVQLEEVEAQHEALQDGVGLEGYDTVQVPLVLGLQHRAVYLPVQQRQEVVFAQRRHVICNITHTCYIASKLKLLYFQALPP